MAHSENEAGVPDYVTRDVEKAWAEAETLQAEIAAKGGEEPNPIQAALNETLETKPVVSLENDPPDADTALDPEATRETETPVPKEPAPDSDVERLTRELETANQRYKTLEGKYSKEMPERAAEVRMHKRRAEEFEQTVSRLETELTALKAKLAAAPAQDGPITRETLMGRGLSADVADELLESMGEKGLRGLMKLTQPEPEKAPKGQPASRPDPQPTAEDMFFGALEQRIPDFEARNKDTGFNAWLREVNPETGITRKAELDASVDHGIATGDSAATAGFFDAYDAHKKAVAARRKKTETMPTPSGGPGAAPGGPKRWDIDAWERAYESINMGRVTGKEAAALKAELDRAVAEKRVHLQTASAGV